MGCGICEHNATYCECTHHEQAAYEKGRSEAQAEIARLQVLLKRREKMLTSCMMQRDTAWNDAIEAAAQVVNDYDQHDLESAIRALRRPT